MNSLRWLFLAALLAVLWCPTAQARQPVTWQRAPSDLLARGAFAVTDGGAAMVGADGRIYVVGDEEGSRNCIGSSICTSMEAYDWHARTWSYLGSLPALLGDFAAVVDGDSIYVLCGGGDPYHLDSPEYKRVDVYSLSTQQWSPGTPSLRQTPGCAATVGRDGRIYVGGGGELMSEAASDFAQVFDPRTSSWKQLPPLPRPLYEPQAVTGPDGRIYVLGGETVGRDVAKPPTVEAGV